MKVRDLKNRLELVSDEHKVNRQLGVISHWVSRLKSKGFSTSDPRDVIALAGLERLGIVKLTMENEKAVPQLTEDGENLYKDFMARGYY